MEIIKKRHEYISRMYNLRNITCLQQHIHTLKNVAAPSKSCTVKVLQCNTLTQPNALCGVGLKGNFQL